MQASQIDPGTVYAVTIYTDSKETYLARFKVEYVESHLKRRKLKATAADYLHKVHGAIDERDVPAELLPADPAERARYLERTLDPTNIQGTYAEIQTLKERAEAEKKAEKEKIDARNKASGDLVKLFFQITGIKPGPKGKWHDDNLFKFTDYSGDVSIDVKGVIPLLAALQQLTANQKPADK
jgi:hypothetical protein